jgi:hypothetical protein
MICGRGSTGSTSARLDALRLQSVRRLHRDQPRLAVGERRLRRLEHGGPRAAAADPAAGHGAIRQDHRLGAGLGGGRRDRAHDGGQREGGPLCLHGGDEIEDVGCGRHHSFAR